MGYLSHSDGELRDLVSVVVVVFEVFDLFDGEVIAVLRNTLVVDLLGVVVEQCEAVICWQ